MTSSAKTYSLRSGQHIVNIPDEFDEQLLQEAKVNSAKPAQAKSSSKSSGKSTPKSTSKSSSVGDRKGSTDKPSRQMLTRSKNSSKTSVRDQWYDETIFDSKRIKHEAKVKKEVPSDDAIYCIKCNETFDSLDALNDHSKNKCYTRYSYNCLDKKCKKTFSQKSNMQQHYYTVHLGKPFKCEYCDRYFTYLKTRTKHTKAMHKDKLTGSVTFKYSCVECKYDTDDKTEFTTHMDRHKQFKRYCCGNCKKGFYSQAHLTYHLTKCFDVEKNEECIKCGMKFSTAKELHVHFKGQHVDTLEGDKYYCDTCIVVFVTRNGYRHHSRTDEHRKKVKKMAV